MSAGASTRRQAWSSHAVALAVLAADVAIAGAAVVVAEPLTTGILALLLIPTLVAAQHLPRGWVVGQIAIVGGAALLTHLPPAEEFGWASALGSLLLVLSSAAAAYVVMRLRARLAHAAAESGRLMRSDPLTGVANQQGLEERITPMWNAATRRKERLTVLVLDVDHLARVNNEHGRPIGDTVLVELAGHIRATVRTEDIVARFGERDLVVVTSVSTMLAPEDIGKRLHRHLASATMAQPVTVSVGAVHYAPTDLDDPLPTFMVLLEDAEHALRAAKDGGGNRVVGYAPPAPQVPPPRSAVS